MVSPHSDSEEKTECVGFYKISPGPSLILCYLLSRMTEAVTLDKTQVESQVRK